MSGHPVKGAADRIPASQLALRAPRLDHFLDPAQLASERRMRALVDPVELDDEALSMCTIVRAGDGGPLRTFSGGLGHENGWWPSHKAGRLLHWEGETALWHLLLAETLRGVARIGTECVGFELPDWLPQSGYTADAELTAPDGTVTIVEVKRSERDLEDPDYRLALAYVAEVCRRCGMRFRLIYRVDLFQGEQHQRNVELFASRAHADVEEAHGRRLADHRRAVGGRTTYAALAEALSPGRPATGRALVQAMLVRRSVDMDLTGRLHDGTAVEIL